MILLCDEDIGTKVPQALTLVRRDARSLVSLGRAGKPDTYWLTEAGRLGWLVFSSNKRMLRVPRERAAILREGAGIVFLTSGEEQLARQLWLLLVKWPWLEEIDANLPRPFAKFLSPTGRVTDSYRDLRL